MVTGIAMTGMASGMDTDEIINEILEIERMPIARMENEKEEISTKQEEWQNINQQLQSLESTFRDLGRRDIYREMDATSSREELMEVSASSSADEGSYTVQINSLAQAHAIRGEELDSSEEPIGEMLDLDFIDGEATFSITEDGETHEFTIHEDDTIRDVRNMINNNNELTMRASIVNNHFALSSNQPGADHEIEAEQLDGDFFNSVGILDANDEISYEMQEARNSEFMINDILVERDTNQGIDDVLEGVVIDLHGASEGEEFTINIGQDLSGIEETISQFVEQYNEVQGHMGQLGEEEGLLQGDSTLRRLQSSLRRQITTDVNLADNEVNNLQSLGIDIDDEGVMTFDETELSTHLNQEPEAVEKFFRASESSDGAQGLGNRMSDFLRSYIRSGDGILYNQSRNFTSQMDRIDRRIDTRQQRIDRRQQTMQRQFAAMEQALNNVQAQGSWLQGQLQSLGMQ